ncbi:MAG: PAS domain-containing protein, partial [Syntrophothermus sp.]
DSVKEWMKAARDHTVLFKPFDNAELTRAVELAYTRHKIKDNFRERCSEISYKRIQGKKSFLQSLDDMIERLSKSVEKSHVQSQFTDFLKVINSSFSELVSSSQDLSLLLIDSEGVITYANENFGTLFGFASRDLKNKNINELLDQESQDKFSFLLKHDSYKLPKGVFLDLKCRNVNNRYLDINCFVEERQDDSGNLFFGIVMAQQKNYLYEGKEVNTEDDNGNVLSSYLMDLRRNLSEALDLTDTKYTSNTNQRLRKSIFNLIAYSDYLTNDFENLEINEIRELAGRINVYLKNINELLYGEEMGVLEKQRIN